MYRKFIVTVLARAIWRGWQVSIVVLGAWLATSCEKQSRLDTSVDLDRFLAEKGAAYGLRYHSTGTATQFVGKWSVQIDATGFVVKISGVSFDAVDSFLKQGLGNPTLSEDKDRSGQPHRMWSPESIGAAVQEVKDADVVQIICINSSALTGTNQPAH